MRWVFKPILFQTFFRERTELFHLFHQMPRPAADLLPRRLADRDRRPRAGSLGVAWRLFSLRHRVASHLNGPASSDNKQYSRHCGKAPAIENAGVKWPI
jgi:hypothetical protein